MDKRQDHCQRNPIFGNKEPSRPIIEHQAMIRVQIGVVVMENKPSTSSNGITYYYILSVLDVFSRFLF